MANFTWNSDIFFVILGNLGDLSLIIVKLGQNKPDKPETRLLDTLISEKTAFPVAIFLRHLQF